MDEPVLIARPEDGVLAGDASAVEGYDDHVIPELVARVGAFVPDAYPDRIAVADRGVVGIVQVRESMVFYADGETVDLGSTGIPLGTAQETSAPLRSRRRSKWWLRA